MQGESNIPSGTPEQRESSGEENMGSFVCCLSIDMIDSTNAGRKYTENQFTRFNISFVNQIKPHLKKLWVPDLSVQFTGDGWQVKTEKSEKIRAICCLAIIMANKFQDEMNEVTKIARDSIPPLRLAICVGKGISVTLPNGNKDWVGDYARRAVRASAWCNPNEIVIDDAVRGNVFRDFHIKDLTEQDHIKPDKWEENFTLYVLERLKLEADSDSEVPEYVYTLRTIGKIEEARTVALRVSERLGDKAIKQGIDEKKRQEILRNWNQLMVSIPDSDYSNALEILKSIKAARLTPDTVTHNALMEKAPDYDNAKARRDTMRKEDILPDVFTYNALMEKAPDYDNAKAWMDTMRKEDILPDVFTYNALIEKAPDYDNAKAWMDTMRKEDILPDVSTYNKLVTMAPDYDTAKALTDTMRKEDVLPDVYTYNALIEKAPDHDNAKALRDTMRKEDILHDVFTYNMLVAIAPNYDIVRAWVDTSRKEHILSDDITYNALVEKDVEYDVAKARVYTMREVGILSFWNYDESKAWMDTMRKEGVLPEVTDDSLIEKTRDYLDKFRMSMPVALPVDNYNLRIMSRNFAKSTVSMRMGLSVANYTADDISYRVAAGKPVLPWLYRSKDLPKTKTLK